MTQRRRTLTMSNPRSAADRLASRRVKPVRGRKPAGDLEPVEARHPDVTQDEIGGQAVDRVERLRPVAGLADGLEARCRVDHVERYLAEDDLVVDREDPYRARVATGLGLGFGRHRSASVGE